MDSLHARIDYILFWLLEFCVVSIVCKIITKPTDVVAVQGDDVVNFKCSTNSDLQIVWGFDNMIETTDDVQFYFWIWPKLRWGQIPNATVSESYGLTEVNLAINELDLDHAGTYTCIERIAPTDLAGGRIVDSHSAQLTVLVSDPLWGIRSDNSLTFEIVSKFDYKGKFSTLISCSEGSDYNFQMIEGTKLITSDQNLVQDVRWTSISLRRYRRNRIFNCRVRIGGIDQSYRRFDRVLIAEGYLGRYEHVNIPETSTPTPEIPINLYVIRYVIACLLLLLSLPILAIFAIWVWCKHRSSATTDQENSSPDLGEPR